MRRLLNLLIALSLLPSVAAAALWVRSHFVGDYVVVRDGDFDGWHVSVARGDVRFARGSWRGPQGQRVFSSPLDSVGEYSALKSVYLPLWTIVIPAAALAAVFRRCSHPRRLPVSCLRCGYDLRATPGRCPECGTEAGRGLPA